MKRYVFVGTTKELEEHGFKRMFATHTWSKSLNGMYENWGEEDFIYVAFDIRDVNFNTHEVLTLNFNLEKERKKLERNDMSIYIKDLIDKGLVVVR